MRTPSDDHEPRPPADCDPLGHVPCGGARRKADGAARIRRGPRSFSHRRRHAGHPGRSVPHRRADGAQGVAGARRRLRPLEARRRAVRGRFLGRGEPPRRARARKGHREARQPLNLRGFVRVGERRKVPPRAESPLAVSQLHRRIHVQARLVQPRGRPGHPAARPRQSDAAARGPHGLAVDHRAHGSAGRVRRAAGGERPGQQRGRRPARAARLHARRGERRGHARQRLPGA